ncbi:hypothetical protein JS81_07500 [Thermoactinomyces sp. Gus2-1]|nr:hypothetical protein JS81_07500 [Thermoactinomyces sp. Gus2-1]
MLLLAFFGLRLLILLTNLLCIGFGSKLSSEFTSLLPLALSLASLLLLLLLLLLSCTSLRSKLGTIFTGLTLSGLLILLTNLLCIGFGFLRSKVFVVHHSFTSR